LFQVNDLSLGKVLFLAVNFYINHIAGNGLINKQHQVVGFTYAPAFFGYINNAYVLKKPVRRILFHHAGKGKAYLVIEKYGLIEEF